MNGVKTMNNINVLKKTDDDFITQGQKVSSCKLGNVIRSDREDSIILPKKEQSIIDENQSKGETFIEKLKKEKVDLDYKLVMDVFATGVRLTSNNLKKLKELKSRKSRTEYLNKCLQNGVANPRKTSEDETINDHINLGLLALYRADTDQLKRVNWVKAALFCETIFKFTEQYLNT